MKNLHTINRLVAHFGGQYKLAQSLGVSSAAVSLWVKDSKIPPMRAIEIEEITKGKFKARELVGE
jgi:DNA-binding transcriptional regulator YdaS (Cro superfamily)